MGASAGTTTAQPFNVNTAASQGLQAAMTGTAGEMGYQPQNVTAAQYNPASMQATGYQGQGYNAALAGSRGYNPALAGSTGYNAAQAGSTGYNAAQVGAGQLASTNLNPYMNPYEQNVISGLQRDAATNLQKGVNMLDTQASAAKAFGGSRHGIAAGEFASNTANALNNQIAQLRQAGFQNAQQMAQQDIATRMQAGLANQAALNQAGQFGASAANQAALANAAALNTAGQFGASAANQAALANQAARNTAGQFGAQAYNQAALANQAARNQAAQFGAGATNTANQFTAGAANTAAAANQAAMNAAGQYNAGNLMQAQLANQNAGLAGSQQRLGAASQMGNLANLGFGMGQQINQQMMQQGAMQQALQQMAMDKAAAQYQGYQQSPYTALNAFTSAIGATPYPQTQTTSQSRGLFDYLGMGLYGAGALGYTPFA